MSENVTNDKEQKKKTLGFKVSPSECNVLQQYAQLFHNQMVQDPDTKQPRRLLERPMIGLLIRNATYAYLVQYQYTIQEQQQQSNSITTPVTTTTEQWRFTWPKRDEKLE